MGFKSRARKRRKKSSGGVGGTGEEPKSEFEGEVPCDIKDCGNWADKKAGGRKMAYDRAVDVWGSSGITKKVRKIPERPRTFSTTVAANEPVEFSENLAAS